ncbi:MAG: hypothetical protein K2X86_09100 [Cytophagaceae bacterium]|nr:hypothetical protein [Cytophagaceae bacterium]
MLSKIDNLKNLKEYASYLLQNKRSEEMALLNIELIRKNYPPLLNFFITSDEQEIQNIFKKSLENFLKDLSQEKGVDGFTRAADMAKQKKLSYLNDNRLAAQDIIIGYTIRKQVLLHFIKDYSSDPYVHIAISHELDAFLFIVQKLAADMYSEKVLH